MFLKEETRRFRKIVSAHMLPLGVIPSQVLWEDTKERVDLISLIINCINNP
jgi:hypothetical protein